MFVLGKLKVFLLLLGIGFLTSCTSGTTTTSGSLFSAASIPFSTSTTSSAPPNAPTNGPTPVQTPGFPTGARARVQIKDNTVVADDGNLLRFGMVWVGFPTDAGTDINFWKQSRDQGHLNGIRIQMHRAGTSNSTLLSMLDQIVANAQATGMYVLLDNHLECCTGQNLPADTALWQLVAPRYANDTNVFYEVKNEPNQPADPTSYVSYETTMYKLIRSLAPDTHIVLWSPTDIVGTSPNVLQYFSPGMFGDPNASFGFHAYGASNNITELETTLNTLRQHYPIITTEVNVNGASGQGNPTTLIKWYESQNISWVIQGVTEIYGGSPGNNMMGNTVWWPSDPGTL